MPISIVVADKGYDSESNHQYVRDHLNAYSLLFHHDMNMYLYGRLMDDIERRWNTDTINYFTIKEIRVRP